MAWLTKDLQNNFLMKNPVNSPMFGVQEIESREIHTNVLPCPFKSNRKFGYVLVLPSKIYHFLYVVVVPVSSLTWVDDAIVGRRTICSRYWDTTTYQIRPSLKLPGMTVELGEKREPSLLPDKKSVLTGWCLSGGLVRTRDNDECRHINIIASSTALYNYVTPPDWVLSERDRTSGIKNQIMIFISPT